MQYSQMIKYIINKKAENTTLRFFVYPFLENTHNTSCYIYTCRMGIHPRQPPSKKPRRVRKSPTA